MRDGFAGPCCGEHKDFFETGHRPLGLADRYRCDGGYFETETFPNLIEDRAQVVKDVIKELEALLQS